MNHTITHAINGCTCEQRDISRCVMCSKPLGYPRTHVDTCGKRCFQALRNAQVSA